MLGIGYQTRFYKTKTLDKAPASMDYVKGDAATKLLGITLYERALNAAGHRLDKMGGDLCHLDRLARRRRGNRVLSYSS